jgi:hypothetical protein
MVSEVKSKCRAVRWCRCISKPSPRNSLAESCKIKYVPSETYPSWTPPSHHFPMHRSLLCSLQEIRVFNQMLSYWEVLRCRPLSIELVFRSICCTGIQLQARYFGFIHSPPTFFLSLFVQRKRSAFLSHLM